MKPKRSESTWKWSVKLTDAAWLHTSCSNHDPLFLTNPSFISLTLFPLPICSQGYTGFQEQPTLPMRVCVFLKFPHYIKSFFNWSSSFRVFIEPVIQSSIQWVLSDWLFICRILWSYLQRCCPSAPGDKTLALCLFKTTEKVGLEFTLFSSTVYNIHAVEDGIFLLKEVIAWWANSAKGQSAHVHG